MKVAAAVVVLASVVLSGCVGGGDGPVPADVFSCRIRVEMHEVGDRDVYDRFDACPFEQGRVVFSQVRAATVDVSWAEDQDPGGVVTVSVGTDSCHRALNGCEVACAAGTEGVLHVALDDALGGFDPERMEVFVYLDETAGAWFDVQVALYTEPVDVGTSTTYPDPRWCAS